MAGRTPSGALLTEINVTPLVDVVLVLLVLMMVTATSLVAKSIPVELPRAGTGNSQGEAPFVVTVDASGGLFLGATRVDDAAVRREARGKDSAVLAADGRARHDAVVHAMELLRSEQVAKIAIVVRAE